MWFSSKVLSLLEACFDFILGSSLSMNIKIMGGKITKNLGFKSLLPKVKNFLLSWNEQVTFYKFILFHLWFDTVFLKILINENEGVTLSCLFCQAGILEITGIVYKGIFTKIWNMIFANDMTFLLFSFQPWWTTISQLGVKQSWSPT